MKKSSQLNSKKFSETLVLSYTRKKITFTISNIYMVLRRKKNLVHLCAATICLYQHIVSILKLYIFEVFRKIRRFIQYILKKKK